MNFVNRASLNLLSFIFMLTAAASSGAGPAPIIQPPVTPPPKSGNPSYAQDTVLSDLTNSGIRQYATFINAAGGDTAAFGGIPYTPTASTLDKGYRVIGTDTPLVPLVVQFSKPVSQIVVFANIDHVGRAWDHYQNAVYGGTLDILNNVVNFTLLFDPISVNEPDVPDIDQNFTLKNWAGVAPTHVNNALTLGSEPPFGLFGPGRGPGGYVGYEEYFDFGASAYEFYGFRASTLARTGPIGSEQESEISAVAEGVRVPEPGPLSLVLTGVLGLMFWRRHGRRAG